MSRTETFPKGIRARGDSLFVDVSHRGKRATDTVSDKGNYPTLLDAAIARRAAMLDDLVNGRDPKDGSSKPSTTRWTVSHAIKMTHRVAWNKAASARKMVYMGKAIEKEFGKTRLLDTITAEELQEWGEKMEEAGKSGATINRHTAALSKVMSVAKSYRALDHKPTIPRWPESKGRIRWVREDEEAQALQYLRQCEPQEVQDAWVVLIDTGMRLGELLKLKVQDVNFKTGFIHLWETKNGDSRAVPMTERVKEVMQRRSVESKLSHLFPYDYNFIRGPWARLREHMGLTNDPQFVPHVLRHTCASRLVQRGVDLRVVKEWLGHKTIQTTIRYAKLAPKNLLEAAKVLEQGPVLTAVKGGR